MHRAALGHCSTGEVVAAAGIPFFIEKPPGISVVEADVSGRVLLRQQGLTFVAFNRRFIPSMVRLKRWTVENPVRFARAEMLRTNRMEPEFAIATGIHVLDAMRFLMGDPTEIEVRRRKYRSSARLRLVGAIAVCECDRG